LARNGASVVNPSTALSNWNQANSPLLLAL
jgi:hypothetical protein